VLAAKAAEAPAEARELIVAAEAAAEEERRIKKSSMPLIWGLRLPLLSEPEVQPAVKGEAVPQAQTAKRAEQPHLEHI